MRYSGADTQYSVVEQITGLWYYRVRASNPGGSSPWSNTESVSVISSAPTLLPINNSDGNGDYLVDWTDVTGAISYRLEEADNSGFSSPTVRYTGANSQFPVSGQQGGAWYYRVRASSGGGDSPWSNTESVTVTPLAPVLLPIENADGDGQYLVRWSDVTGETGYFLQEDDNPGFSSPVTRYQGAYTQFEVVGQEDGTWYYRVRAYSNAGNSPWSGSQAVVVGGWRLYLPMVLRGY